MPFYEYECKNCGHALEAMQKVSDPPLKKCPHCGKSQLQRLMSAPVFRLKGSGWYETDFKGDNDNKRNLAEKPEADAAKDAVKADATATDAKADAKGADAKADAKAADAKGGDGKGADAKGGGAKGDVKASDSKGSDSASGAGKAKAGDKPMRKSAAGARRAATPKPVARRPAKKPAPKLKRRR